MTTNFAEQKGSSNSKNGSIRVTNAFFVSAPGMRGIEIF
jgi:hypothetical protein